MIWRLLLLLACLSILDGLLTLTEVSSGIACELNPLMRAVLPFGLAAVLSVKGVPIAALSVCAFAGQAPMRAVRLLTMIYGAVIGWHMLVLGAA